MAAKRDVVIKAREPRATSFEHRANLLICFLLVTRGSKLATWFRLARLGCGVFQYLRVENLLDLFDQAAARIGLRQEVRAVYRIFGVVFCVSIT